MAKRRAIAMAALCLLLTAPLGAGADSASKPVWKSTVRTGAEQSSRIPKAEYTPYLQDLRRRVRHHWYPPKHGTEVVVRFKLKRNGDLIPNPVVTKSGGVSSDKAAIAAIENAAPFRMMPNGSEEVEEFQFRFDPHLFGNGQNRDLIGPIRP